MENRSTHYGDVKNWIEKVIDSCENKEQLMTTRKLIKNFDKQLRNRHIDRYWNTYSYELIKPLEFYVEEKIKNI
jgi:hypothetical protein